jgi:hypothetical protein
VGTNGDVYVSEAGSVGEDCVNPKDGPCFGFTSAIQRYTGLGTATSSREALASGIVSMAMLRPEGPEVLGVAGIDLTDEGELVGIMMFINDRPCFDPRAQPMEVGGHARHHFFDS